MWRLQGLRGRHILEVLSCACHTDLIAFNRVLGVMGYFLNHQSSRNTVNCAAVLHRVVGMGYISSHHRTAPKDEICPTATCVWCSQRALLCSGRAYVKSRGENTHREQVSRGVLPHCLWPRQSHLPAGARCSMAFSRELLSSSGELEVLGSLSCCLQSQQELVVYYVLPRKRYLSVWSRLSWNTRAFLSARSTWLWDSHQKWVRRF